MCLDVDGTYTEHRLITGGSAKNNFIVPVYVKKTDIIAFGYAEDVAVKKYEIKQEDWDAVLKPFLEKCKGRKTKCVSP